MLSRILSRYIRVWNKNRLYFWDQNPSWDLIQYAEERANKIIAGNSLSLLSRDECIKILIDREILPENYKKILSRYEKSLLAQQKRLYLADGNIPKETEIRKAITKLRSSIAILRDNESTLDYICRENYEQFVLDLELIKLSTFNSRRQPAKRMPVWVIYLCKLNQVVGNRELRKMARTEPFRLHWTINKLKVFRGFPLTDTQLVLASYSRMYDNVYKSIDSPPEHIINDDDKLDGWWETQKDERSSSKSKVTNRSEQHGEVFQVVSNKDEAQQVYDSNSAEARQLQRRRLAQLKQQGIVNFANFQDIQQQRAMQNAAAQNK